MNYHIYHSYSGRFLYARCHNGTVTLALGPIECATVLPLDQASRLANAYTIITGDHALTLEPAEADPTPAPRA